MSRLWNCVPDSGNKFLSAAKTILCFGESRGAIDHGVVSITNAESSQLGDLRESRKHLEELHGSRS